MEKTPSDNPEFAKQVNEWINEELGQGEDEKPKAAPEGREPLPDEVIFSLGKEPEDLNPLVESAAKELAAAKEVADELGNRDAINELRRPGDPMRGVKPGKLRVLAEKIAGKERASDILGQLETMISSGEISPEQMVEKLRDNLKEDKRLDEDDKVVANSLLSNKILEIGLGEKERTKDPDANTYELGTQVIIRQALENPELNRMLNEVFEKLPKDDMEKAIEGLESAFASEEINEKIKHIAEQVKTKNVKPKPRFGAAREKALKDNPDIQPIEVKSRGRKPVEKKSFGGRMKKWFKKNILGIK
jgi:hypothetical protein